MESLLCSEQNSWSQCVERLQCPLQTEVIGAYMHMCVHAYVCVLVCVCVCVCVLFVCALFTSLLVA